jgi:hypothetical protein
MKECEADCATGDCLAFRNGGETAMTCIVYCKAAGDCPTGFICNGSPQRAGSPSRIEEADAPLTGICVRSGPISNGSPTGGTAD